MTVVLNTETETTHQPRGESSEHDASCGALMYVPEEHVERVSRSAAGSDDETSRCGRCFVDGGGY
jgi:hypothetical protein